MTLNPFFLLGKQVAASWPKIEDWESAVEHMMQECITRGVVDPDRKTIVGALLMGYLLYGKERRQCSE